MPFIQFQFRRGTSSQWNTTNPLLADGEIGIETDTNKFKLGNGVNNWSSLAYGGVQGVQGTQGTQGPQGTQGVQGPQGTQGVQGIGFIWRGAWSSATTYGINHAVFYNGTSYVSLTAANVNKVPPSFTSDWGVIASQGVQGPQGTQGLQGLQGVQGTQGLQGLQGTQGLQGLNGLFAGQGVQGTQGIQGTIGINSRTVSYFNAASNQTTFNVVGGYLSNRVDVFKNGVKLQRVSDYTDTSGTDIVLVAPATDNDLIEIITYTAIPQMSDVYTQAQSDARYVNNQKLFAVNWIFGA